MSKPTITFGQIEESGSFFNPVEAQPPNRFERIEDEEEAEKEEKPKAKKEQDKKVEPKLILNDFADEDNDEDIEETITEESETETIIEAALDDDETDYKELTLQLIKLGQWERFNPEEGVEIEDLEELTKEDFELIAKTQSDWKKNEVENKLYEGLSNDEKEFIDFKKNGGDINVFIQNYLYKQQAQNLDIESDNGKKNTIYAYYKSATNWSDDRIVKYIHRLEKDLELEDEAKMAKRELEEKTRSEYEKILEEQEKAKKETQEKLKEYRSNIRKNLKERSYDKKKTDSIVKALTDVDERGFAPVDRAYLDIRNDPDKAEIIYNVLLNYDEWIKTVGQEKVNEANLKTFKTIKLNKKGSDDDNENYSSPRKKSNNKDLIIELPKKR